MKLWGNVNINIPLILMKIGVIGTGSWGTALIKVLNDNGHFIKWYIHEPQTLEYLQTYHSNPNHFPECRLNFELISLYSQASEIFKETELILLACPSAYLPFNLQNITKEDFQNKIIVSAIKGFIGEEAFFVSEYLEKEFQVNPQQFAVLSGPSHAEEVIQKKITFLQWGCFNVENNYPKIFENEYFKVRCTTDFLGLQLAGILKNVYAIALGIIKGLHFGDNLQAALTTSSSKETMKIFQSLNYPVNDFLQYGYLGDLLVTAYSPHSRNRNLGIGVGQGKPIQSLFRELKTIPEGYFTLQKLPKKLEIQQFPIIYFTQKCLTNPHHSFQNLMELLNKL